MMSEIERYLKEILNLIHRKNDLDQILFDLSLFADRIGYQSSVRSSGEDPEKRKALIVTQMSILESEILQSYFSSLLDKGELWIFDPGHFKVFTQELNEAAEKITFFTLTTAIELNKEDLKLLTDKMTKRMERKVVIDLTVDKAILGGAIIKRENYIFDFSLRTKLNNLGNEWRKSIQKAKAANA